MQKVVTPTRVHPAAQTRGRLGPPYQPNPTGRYHPLTPPLTPHGMASALRAWLQGIGRAALQKRTYASAAGVYSPGTSSGVVGIPTSSRRPIVSMTDCVQSLPAS